MAPCPSVPATAGVQGRGVVTAEGPQAKLGISKGPAKANPTAWGLRSPWPFTACLNPCPSFPVSSLFLEWDGFTLWDLQGVNESY